MAERLKVMIVDDDATTLTVLSAILERQGHDVIARDTSLGTSLAISREKPDVVLLDVRMPGLSGDRLARVISSNETGHRPLIILHSSAPKLELKELALRCGASSAIEKTGDPAEFLRRFNQAIAGRDAAGKKKVL